MPAYALTIFTGAFLLFQVQPIIGKYILPWFGGGPGVWTTCLLFFQVALLGGYAYAHFISRLKPRAQAITHLIVLAAALALLPITPADFWKPRGGGNPTLQILALLAANLGLPYFVLSSTSPLMQQWFSRAHPGASPYRLYALSNFGSLLALASYPFYFETRFTRKAQAGFWACGLAVFALCCGFCAIEFWRKAGRVRQVESGGEAVSATFDTRPSILDRLFWLLLPACASVLLLATTNKMCQDVAVIPFLWVLPLALYLLSFVICFDSPRWYVRFPFTLALIAAMGGIWWALFEGIELPLYKQVAIYSAALFICCMVCHGELYRLRPAPRHLTGFYLMIAAGGALGGLFVAVIAPMLFADYYELHWGLLGCALLFTLVCTRDRNSISMRHWRWIASALALAAFGGLDQALAWLGANGGMAKSVAIKFRLGMWIVVALLVASWIARKKFRNFQHWRLIACVWLSLGCLALGAALLALARKSNSDAVSQSRNFYGTLTVFEYSKDDPASHYFLLRHGRITHGLQFADPVRAAWPTSYYGEKSGVGLAVRALPAGGRRIGLVGLGTGTLMAYAQAGDSVRIYEINPDVKRIATSQFTYLSRSPAKVEVALGDARLSMEREPPQRFDLLVLDAFSSDAIPVHLLTKEAFDIYERHVKTNGIIAVHVSNHYLNLEPVVVNLARHFHYELAAISYDETENEWWNYASTWILLTHSKEILDSLAIRDAASDVETNSVNVPLWTDDFASLFQILR